MNLANFATLSSSPKSDRQFTWSKVDGFSRPFSSVKSEDIKRARDFIHRERDPRYADDRLSFLAEQLQRGVPNPELRNTLVDLAEQGSKDRAASKAMLKNPMAEMDAFKNAQSCPETICKAC